MVLRRALLFSFAGKYLTMLIDFASVMIVSRLLSPAEIGVYSLAAASVVIGQMLRDFGLSLYIIQEKDLSTEKIQTCFTISLLLCWTIAGVYYLSAPFIAGFLNATGVEELIKILAFNFLIIPFGTFTLAVLKREMKFEKLMLIDVASTIVRVAALLTMLFYGVGVVAMAYSSVMGTVTTMLMTLPFKDWSHYRIRFQNFRHIAAFSTTISMTNILAELRQIIAEFAIGKQLSVEAVAFYSKASSTTALFSKLILQVISPAIQPYLANLRRNEGDVKSTMLKVFTYVQALSFPFYLFLFYFSEEVILLLYGPQWGTVPPLLEIFCLSMAVANFFPVTDQIFNVTGHEKFVLRLATTLMFLRLAMIGGFVVYDLSLVQLVSMFAALSVTRSLVVAIKLRAAFQIGFFENARVLMHNASIGLVLLGSFYIEKQWLKMDASDYLQFAAIGAASFGIWIALILATRHPVSEEILRYGKVQKLLKLKPW